MVPNFHQNVSNCPEKGEKLGLRGLLGETGRNPTTVALTELALLAVDKHLPPAAGGEKPGAACAALPPGIPHSLSTVQHRPQQPENGRNGGKARLAELPNL